MDDEEFWLRWGDLQYCLEKLGKWKSNKESAEKMEADRIAHLMELSKNSIKPKNYTRFKKK